MRGVKIVSRTETTKIIVDDETRPIPIIVFLIFTVATTGVSIWGIVSEASSTQRFVAFVMAVVYFIVSALIFSAYSTTVTKQSTYKYKVIVAEGTNMDEFHEK